MSILLIICIGIGLFFFLKKRSAIKKQKNLERNWEYIGDALFEREGEATSIFRDILSKATCLGENSSEVNTSDIKSWANAVLNFIFMDNNLTAFLVKGVIDDTEDLLENSYLKEALAEEEHKEYQPINILFATITEELYKRNKLNLLLAKVSTTSWCRLNSVLFWKDFNNNNMKDTFDIYHDILLAKINEKKQEEYAASLYIFGNTVSQEYIKNEKRVKETLQDTNLDRATRIFYKAGMFGDKRTPIKKLRKDMKNIFEYIYNDDTLTDFYLRAIDYSSKGETKSFLKAYLAEKDHAIKPLQALLIICITDLDKKTHKLEPIYISPWHKWFQQGVKEKEKLYKFLQSDVDFMADYVYYKDSHAKLVEE